MFRQISGAIGAAPEVANLKRKLKQHMATFGGFDEEPDDVWREKIEAARKKLPLPELMEKLGEEAHAHKSALCPFHTDHSPSFSVYRRVDGRWGWNCFAGCGGGDEIDYLQIRKGMIPGEAIQEFLRLAAEDAEEVDGDSEAANDNDWNNFDD